MGNNNRSETIVLPFQLANIMRESALRFDPDVSHHEMVNKMFRHNIESIAFKLHQRTIFVNTDVNLPLTNSEACAFYMLGQTIVNKLPPFEMAFLTPVLIKLHQKFS